MKLDYTNSITFRVKNASDEAKMITLLDPEYDNGKWVFIYDTMGKLEIQKEIFKHLNIGSGDKTATDILTSENVLQCLDILCPKMLTEVILWSTIKGERGTSEKIPHKIVINPMQQQSCILRYECHKLFGDKSKAAHFIFGENLTWEIEVPANTWYDFRLYLSQSIIK
jgi:hypothetical protein